MLLQLEFYPSSFVSTVTFPNCFYLSEEKGELPVKEHNQEKNVNTYTMILEDRRTIIMGSATAREYSSLRR
jgi:hypothetical protein